VAALRRLAVIQLCKLLRLAAIEGLDPMEFRELIEAVLGREVEDVIVDEEGCRFATESGYVVAWRELAPDGRWHVEEA